MLCAGGAVDCGISMWCSRFTVYCIVKPGGLSCIRAAVACVLGATQNVLLVLQPIPCQEGFQ